MSRFVTLARNANQPGKISSKAVRSFRHRQSLMMSDFSASWKHMLALLYLVAKKKRRVWREKERHFSIAGQPLHFFGNFPIVLHVMHSNEY
tara:strand:- start:6096 stop:6368 length:273 start_codon:yes stop_codon:yes gene_type:complete